jgi:exodeoxyribonuclease VII large subunit
LDQLITHLQALSPLQVLERGYALVFDSAGKLVKGTAQLHPGEAVHTRVAHGSFTATVNAIDPET